MHAAEEAMGSWDQPKGLPTYITKIPLVSYGQIYVAVYYPVQKWQVFGNHPESHVAAMSHLHNIGCICKVLT